jgi:hypothetical protein
MLCYIWIVSAQWEQGDGIRLKPPLEMSRLMTPGIQAGVYDFAFLVDTAKN